MEWRRETKTKDEIINYIKNQPDEYLWAVVLDANDSGDRITPVMIGFFIFAYSHMANDLVHHENWFIENRLKFKLSRSGNTRFCEATPDEKARHAKVKSHRKRNIRPIISDNSRQSRGIGKTNTDNQD
jgi:hypothetical protein